MAHAVGVRCFDNELRVINTLCLSFRLLYPIEYLTVVDVAMWFDIFGQVIVDLWS